MGAFAEARYFAWERLEADQHFPVKAHSLSAEHILGNAETARPFIGGPVLLVRLAPVDYHHVHYPDDGQDLGPRSAGAPPWTVNWHALLNKQDILFRNERHINTWKHANFGRLAFVEVGALSVGRIRTSSSPGCPFPARRGKVGLSFRRLGHRRFGEQGTWRPSDDLLEHTNEGVETLVRLANLWAAGL